MPALVECVPNFSEGRDKSKVDAILEAMKMDGVYLLDREMDADHNRCVITLVGDPVNVAEAAVRGVGKAAELIDLTKHTGAHPRLGAADVIPFIPIEGLTLEDCVAIARRVGEEIWKRYQVPLPYFFADTAGNGHAVFQRQTFNRDERNYIGCAKPGMRSRVLGQINKFGGLANPANRGLRHVHRIADERDDTAVVVGVHLAVEQIHAIHLHGFENGIDFGLVAPFRKVRYTFYECGHKR